MGRARGTGRAPALLRLPLRIPDDLPKVLVRAPDKPTFAPTGCAAATSPPAAADAYTEGMRANVDDCRHAPAGACPFRPIS